MTLQRLQKLSSVPLEIVWHENKSTYLTVSKKQRTLCLRLHRLFETAPTPVLEALLRYAMKKDRTAGAIVKQMAHLYFSQNQIAAELLSTQGKVYDLQEIYDRFNRSLGIDGVSIGWSKRAYRGAFRSLTFGTFDKHCGQIRINSLLDDELVPRYFLEFVVYHEMLHAVCPSKIDSAGRCSVHTNEFRAKERLFPQYKEARAWEKTSLLFFKRRKKVHGRS